jgi:hypothetical protein
MLSFYEGSLDVPKLNHAMVCLIPKVNEEENTFLKYRPIHSLVNSSKIISKILTKRLLAKEGHR